jgi:hypothetical protein
MNGNGDWRLAIFNLLIRTLSSHFLYDIPEIFEKDNFYRINFVVYNWKVNIEIELARDVDNLFVSELA